MDEQDRTARVQPDQQGDQGHERGEEDQAGDRGHQADPARHGLVEAGAAEVPGEGQGARRHRLDGDLAGEALQDLDAVQDGDPPHAGLEQAVDRQPAPAIAQGHDDPPGPGARDDVIEVLERPENRRAIRRRRAAGAFADEPDDPVAGLGPRIDLLCDPPGQRARPQHQGPPHERRARRDAIDERPQRQDDRQNDREDRDRGEARDSGRRDHPPGRERQDQGQHGRTRQPRQKVPESPDGVKIVEFLVVEGDRAGQRERQGALEGAVEVAGAAGVGAHH